MHSMIITSQFVYHNVFLKNDKRKSLSLLGKSPSSEILWKCPLICIMNKYYCIQYYTAMFFFFLEMSSSTRHVFLFLLRQQFLHCSQWPTSCWSKMMKSYWKLIFFIADTYQLSLTKTKIINKVYQFILLLIKSFVSITGQK